jgi:TP901 family phage tail tape measure protein
MAQLGIQVDIDDALSAFAKYNDTLDKVESNINEVTRRFIDFDNKGNKLKETITGLTKEGNAVVLTLHAMEDGSESASLSFKNLAKSIEQTAKAEVDLFIKTQNAESARARLQAKINTDIQKELENNAIAREKATTAAGKSSEELVRQNQKVTDELTRAKNAAFDFSQQLRTISSIVERFVLYKAVNLATDALFEGVRAAKDYQIQLSLIRTISQDNQLSTGTWSKGLKEVSDQLGLPLAETAKAAYDAVSNQVVRGAQTFEFLKTAGDLARTTGGTIGDSVNTLSTIINSYNLSTKEAANISALLFNTIDEGRVKLNDLANSLGPIVTLGKGLGVEITDVTASIAFLTQKGVSSAQALTFMRNVFVQLEKPTTELKELFKEIGVTSGEAAISTFGFVGVLDKINKAVKGGNTGVAALFPEIRANQPIQAILNDTANFERIIKQQKDLTTLTTTYQNAIEIRAESPADFINKEFNKLKNTFTTDIGNKINDLVKDILVFFSSGKTLTEGLNDLLITVRNGTVVFITFRTTLGLTRAAMLLYAVSTAQTAGATASLTATSITASATLKAIPFAALAAAIGYVATKLLFTNDLLKETGSAFAEFDDRIKAQQERITKPTENPNASLVKNIDESSQHALQILSQLSLKNNEVLDRVRSNNQSLTQELSSSFGTYVATLKNRVTEVKRVGEDAENVIRGLSRSALNFAQNIEQSILGTKLKYATEIQAVKLLTGEIDKQKAKAADLSLTGKPEDAREALKIYDDIEKLVVTRADKIVEIAKAGNLNFARDFKGLNIDQSAFGKAFETEQSPFERGGNALTVNVEKLLGTELNSLKEQRLVIEQNINKTLQERKSLAESEAIDEGKRIKDIEAAFKKFNEFSVFDKSGKVKREFTDPLSGKLNSDKVEESIRKSADDLRKLGGSDFGSQANLEEKIQQRTANLSREAALAIRQATIEEAQQQVNQAKNELKLKIENNQKEIDDRSERNKTFLKQLQTDAATFKVLKDPIEVSQGSSGATQLARANNELFNKIGRLGGLVSPENQLFHFDEKAIVGDTQSIEAIKKKTNLLDFQLERYNKLVDNIKKNADVVNGAFVPKAKDIDEAKSEIEQIFGTINQLLKSNFDSDNKGNFDPDAPNPLLGGRSPNAVKKAALSVFEDISKNNKQLAGLVGDQTRIEIQFEAGTKQSLELLDKNFTAQDLNINRQIEAAVNNTSALDKLTIALKSIGSIPTIPIEPGKAAGGWIGGKPGYDANLTPTTRGEFVVNADSAASYSDVLESINRSRGGFVYNSGNSQVSSTRVGDVIVNINVKNGGDIDVRDIGQRLSREIKRGNLRLN